MEINNEGLAEMMKIFSGVTKELSKVNEMIKKISDEEIKKQPKAKQAELRKRFDTGEVNKALKDLQALNIK